MQVDVIGLNCATGPVEMASRSDTSLPTAGCPSRACPTPAAVGGRRQDALRLTADQLAEHLHRFVTEHGVRAIGGAAGRPRPPRRRRRAVRGRHPALASRSSSRLPRPSTPPSGSSRTPRSWWSASAPTPTAQSGSARPCSRRLGHHRRHGPRPDQRGQPRHRRVRGLHRRRRRRRHDEVASRFATQSSPPHGRHNRRAVAEAALQWLGGRPS